jgi:hypothetical protein
VRVGWVVGFGDELELLYLVRVCVGRVLGVELTGCRCRYDSVACVVCG